LSGPVSAVCTANRLWQFGDNSGPGGATADNKPRCRKISCETPVAVDNAFFENKTYLYGDEVTYECNPGYDLVPLSNKFHCTANEGDVLVSIVRFCNQMLAHSSFCWSLDTRQRNGLTPKQEVWVRFPIWSQQIPGLTEDFKNACSSSWLQGKVHL